MPRPRLTHPECRLKPFLEAEDRSVHFAHLPFTGSLFFHSRLPNKKISWKTFSICSGEGMLNWYVARSTAFILQKAVYECSVLELVNFCNGCVPKMGRKRRTNSGRNTLADHSHLWKVCIKERWRQTEHLKKNSLFMGSVKWGLLPLTHRCCLRRHYIEC